MATLAKSVIKSFIPTLWDAAVGFVLPLLKGVWSIVTAAFQEVKVTARRCIDSIVTFTRTLEFKLAI